jgi:hypothetical protein
MHPCEFRVSPGRGRKLPLWSTLLVGFPPGGRSLRLSLLLPALTTAALALAGCSSSSDYANNPRPPVPINVSAAISPTKVTVSPQKFGAGPVTFLIANLTNDTQTVTVETVGQGTKQSSSPINPQGTTTLKVDVSEGSYIVHTQSSTIREAHLTVGAKRPSSQDTLLQP